MRKKEIEKIIEAKEYIKSQHEKGITLNYFANECRISINSLKNLISDKSDIQRISDNMRKMVSFYETCRRKDAIYQFIRDNSIDELFDSSLGIGAFLIYRNRYDSLDNFCKQFIEILDDGSCVVTHVDSAGFASMFNGVTLMGENQFMCVISGGAPMRFESYSFNFAPAEAEPVDMAPLGGSCVCVSVSGKVFGSRCFALSVKALREAKDAQLPGFRPAYNKETLGIFSKAMHADITYLRGLGCDI